jgi:hypothetical protein
MLAKLEDYGLAVRLKRMEVPMLELLVDPRSAESSERSLMSDALESSVQIKGPDKPKLYYPPSRSLPV